MNEEEYNMPTFEKPQRPQRKMKRMKMKKW
jgi:hypothetical protein